MPDWFYRTVSQPLLFRLSARRGRDLALTIMGRLARLPLGPQLIDVLGHMRPAARLETRMRETIVRSPIGLGPHVDGEAVALPALARFGVGFLDVGPVSVAARGPNSSVERRDARQAIWLPHPPPTLAIDAVRSRLQEAAHLGVPLVVRVHLVATDPMAAREELTHLVKQLPMDSTHIAIPLEIGAAWTDEAWASLIADLPPRSMMMISAETPFGAIEARLRMAVAKGPADILVDGAIVEMGEDRAVAGRLVGLPSRDRVRARVRELRSAFGGDVGIIASGGVHEPDDAVNLSLDGADLIEVDSGLVFTGPGLIKRCNEAILWRRIQNAPPPPPSRAAEMSWFWLLLLGVGMFIGSLLALGIAATRVILPYDEVFVGLNREELHAINPRLLAFLAHDRVSLAGTMVSLGVLYIGLSLGAVRRGEHWAQMAVFVSSFVGFATFFSFLGYGYLDPFHAFVALALLQLMMMAIHCRLGESRPSTAPDRHGDEAWLRGLWGQFVFIGHAVGLLGAGVVISVIGMTSVFVHEDLAFLKTTAEALHAAHPRLVPLVAHDRATMGGMLLANGIAFLLASLWGFRRGAAWLWWTMLAAALPAYIAAITVHFVVGYTDSFHLLPAFLGLGAVTLALTLSAEYLLTPERSDGTADRKNVGET